MAPKHYGPNVSRIIFVRNLPYKATGEDVYAIFGKFGAIRQVRLGKNERKGNAFVVFHAIQDAKRAMDALSGFNADGRFLILAYFKPTRKALAAGGEEGDEGGVAPVSVPSAAE